MENIDPFTAKADVTHFISLALQKELSWNALSIVLDAFKSSNEQYKTIVKLLLKELEQLQEQLESKDNQVSEAEYSNEIYDSYQSPYMIIFIWIMSERYDNKYIFQVIEIKSAE